MWLRNGLERGARRGAAVVATLAIAGRAAAADTIAPTPGRDGAPVPDGTAGVPPVDSPAWAARGETRTGTPDTVPEPATFALVAAGVLALAGANALRRRRG